jgi:4-hydroxy-tetrahydrodipicolinate reductase
VRIAIVGDGKMGHAVAERARARGHAVHALIGRADLDAGGALPADRLRGADVAIEFTRPDAAVANLRQLVELGLPTVTGTTGWSDRLPEVTELVRRRGAALLHAANFSIGVQLFLRAAGELAELARRMPELDGLIVEEHHATKRDAPSGTGLALQGTVRAADAERAYPITSIRAGSIPGSHALRYEGPWDSIALTHTAHSRDGFAAGAVAAAEWLPGRAGVFTFESMLFGTDA